MQLTFGNLSIEQFEKRMGVTLSESEREFLKAARQNNAQVEKPDKLHIFDIPFAIVCGSEDLSKKVLELLSPYSGKIEETLQISHI